MPRTRVPDDRRQRARKACILCKSSKKRCDAQLPCAPCVAKGWESSCRYLVSSKRQRNENIRQSPSLHNAANVSTPSVKSASQNAFSPCHDNTAASNDVDKKGKTNASVSGHDDLATLLTECSYGKRVLGNSSIASFLYVIRDTLQQYAGLSPFSEDMIRDAMFEEHPRKCPQDKLSKVNETGADRMSLIQCFLQVTSGLLYIFTPTRLSHFVAALDKHEVSLSEDDRAAVYIALAIGARCRSKDDSDQRRAVYYFAEAQTLAFRHMLDQPSLHMIINFTLMSFYLLCDGRRDTASLYLGIAVRAGTTLGLDLFEPDDASLSESQNLKMQVWRSVCILDFQLSATLGLPVTVHMVGCNHKSDFEMTQGITTYSLLALEANFSLSRLAESIPENLGNRVSDISSAESHLWSIRMWAQKLPEVLRQDVQRNQCRSVEWLDRVRILGNIHVACNYYFWVVIITRRFLVDKVISTLKTQEDPSLNWDESSTYKTSVGETAEKMDELAQTCLSAAAYLVQMCHDALEESLLVSNMCILQSWVFAAGLVLGFALLSGPESNTYETETSFFLSRRILNHFSNSNPQTQRDSELLSGLAEALDTHCRNQHLRRVGHKQMYLEKISRPRLPAGTMEQTPSEETPETMITDTAASSVAGELEKTTEEASLDTHQTLAQSDEFDTFCWMNTPGGIEEFQTNNDTEPAESWGSDTIAYKLDTELDFGGLSALWMPQSCHDKLSDQLKGS